MSSIGPFIMEAGRYWLDPEKLADTELAAGLEDFDQLEYMGKRFELQGRRPSDGWWWCELIMETQPAPPDTPLARALAPLDPEGHGSTPEAA